MKSKREGFLAGRSALSDEEFALRTGVPFDMRHLVLAARQALATVCQIPATHIYPDDCPEAIAALVTDWDDLNVVLRLEELIHVSIADPGEDFPRFLSGRFFLRKWPGPKSVGEWVVQVAHHVHANKDATNSPR